MIVIIETKESQKNKNANSFSFNTFCIKKHWKAWQCWCFHPLELARRTWLSATAKQILDTNDHWNCSYPWKNAACFPADSTRDVHSEVDAPKIAINSKESFQYNQLTHWIENEEKFRHQIATRERHAKPSLTLGSNCTNRLLDISEKSQEKDTRLLTYKRGKTHKVFYCHCF